MTFVETPAPPAVSSRRWALLGLLCLAQLMLILDVTVVNVALPDIGTDLHLHRAVQPWVLTAYTLAFGGLMLLGGRLADLVGGRRMLLIGLAVFTAASLTSGLAGSATALLAGRAVQGVGAALLSPAALSVLTTTFTGSQRGKALGACAALSGAGSALGVVLGGVLTSGPGWRWIFFINVPIGVAVLLVLPGMCRHGSRWRGAEAWT
jgi:MFS family permease